MNYKKIGIIFGIISFILIINNIFGAGQCIEEIMGRHPDGAIINPQLYNLKFEAPKNKPVVIEVIQGGYFETRKYCINVSEDKVVNIYGWLNTRTAPLQVICYDAIDPDMGGSVTPGTSSENGCWQKGRTLQTYSLFINKEEGIEESIKGVGTTISNTSLLNSTIPTDYNITTNESTTQKENNDNRILLILFGIILCVLSVGIYILTYKKGYKIIGIGIWFSLSLFSLIVLNDPYRLLSLIGIFFSIYLMIIWIKENAINIMKGKKDKI